MAVRKIYTFPDPVLRVKAHPITEFGEELKALAADMAETMYKAPGVGLAANQIGVTKQILVYDISRAEEEPALTVLINPEIIEAAGSEIGEEGCLSVIELCAKVKRAKMIRVHALDLDGNPISIEAEDFHARVLQHEIDHLNGVLFLDHLSPLKRSLYKKKLKKLLQEEQEEAAD
ncbi:MAG: peptide deformylase [Proteobacteria bacterium]|nr:peptide deformylase [Pseudomonadota bacterium]MBU1736799.1 peptide deformylase [Pseudomonadota bacterium]